MVVFFVRPFIWLGEEIADIKMIFTLIDDDKPNDLSEDDKTQIGDHLTKLIEQCDKLALPVSKTLITKRLKDPPKTGREFEILIDALDSEIRDKLFIFIPQHRRKFFHAKRFLSDAAKNSFPSAYAELRPGGKCFALGLYTAAVFHSMRGVELGMRSLADELQVTFSFPKELADWESLINQIEAKVREMKNFPKSADKDKDLNFYSMAGMQFRYFKDGWRIRVAHTRETYDEGQALAAIDHAVSFFETLAPRLSEIV